MPRVTDKVGVYEHAIGGTMVDGIIYEPHEYMQASLALQVVIVKLLKDISNRIDRVTRSDEE